MVRRWYALRLVMTPLQSVCDGSLLFLKSSVRAELRALVDGFAWTHPIRELQLFIGLPARSGARMLLKRADRKSVV